MSPESLSVLLAALTVLVGSTVLFGHRYVDKSGKFDEKSKLDELNEIRMAIRSDTTVSALDTIWRFLVETDQKMRREGEKMDAKSLLYDTSRRDYFNKLINDLERTFRDSMNARKTWDNLRLQYRKLGNILYGSATITGLVGYPLLFLSSQSASFLSLPQYYLLGVFLIIVGIIVLGCIIYTRGKIEHNLKIYKEFKKKYLIDELRIGK